MESAGMNQVGTAHSDGTTLRRLAAIVESSNDAIIGKDLNGIVTSWNRAAEKLYGYTASEVIGHSISILLPKGAEDELPTLMLRINAGEHIEHFETARVKKNGKYVDVELNISPILDSDGKVTGAATIVRDLTRQKKTDAVLRALSTMEATSLLAGGVAHDLNNLMAAVLGNAELLALELRDRPQILDSLDVILTSAQMAGKLAQELLAFARGGRHESAIVNINNIALEVLGIQVTIIPPGVTIKKLLSADIHNIEADTSQMKQVLHNLTINAIEAVNGKGVVTISTCNFNVDEAFAEDHFGLTAGPYVVITVGDNGCGMSPEILSHVFKPFFSTKEKGRGLGLAAVYGIVKNHGGYVSAEATGGNGACFKVYLPSTTRELENPQPKFIGGSKGTETILVVDDEVQLLMLNRRILEASGYHVLTARDGSEALRVASEFEGDIHLVVLDMAMPVMDGAKAFTLLKQVRPTCKIIISSGYDLNDSARSLLVSGADAFLQKPFRMTDLTTEVRRLLDSNPITGSDKP